MMPLDLMSRILETVDSKWCSFFVESMLERWNPDQDTLHYLRTSANAVFIFRSSEKPCYFRINASIERSLNKLEAEMALLNDLYDEGDSFGETDTLRAWSVGRDLRYRNRPLLRCRLRRHRR
jgi:hypothetical protein